jgi:arylsulfatase A-like enzyme
MLECLGLEVPAYLPGRSLKPYLDGSAALSEVGRTRGHRDAVLTEFRPFGGPNMKVLHSGEWRYVYYAGEPYGELFNLREDPEERRNLFGDPAYADVERRLQARLLEELVLTEAAWPSRGPWL